MKVITAGLLYVVCCLTDLLSAAYFVSPSDSSVLHTGSRDDPFAGLHQALLATQSKDEAVLSLLPSTTSFRVTSSLEVKQRLSVEGNRQLLVFNASILVRSGAFLQLFNLTIQASTEVLNQLCLVEGSLLLNDCLLRQLQVPAVKVMGGVFKAMNSTFEANSKVSVCVEAWMSSVLLDSVHVSGHLNTFVLINPTQGSGNVSFTLLNSTLESCQGSDPLFDMRLQVPDALHRGEVSLFASNFSENSVPLLSLDLQMAWVSLRSPALLSQLCHRAQNSASVLRLRNTPHCVEGQPRCVPGCLGLYRDFDSLQPHISGATRRRVDHAV